MEGFEKIELETPVTSKTAVPSDYSKVRPQASRKRFGFKFNSRRNFVIYSVIAVLLILLVFAIVLPVQRVARSAKVTYDQAKLTLAAVKTQNIALASTQLTQTKADLDQTQKDLNSLAVLGFIPVVGWYYNDAQHLVKASFDGLAGARVIIDSVAPYADVLGLKGQGSFAAGSAENRIQTAVTTMSKVTPRIDDVEKYLLLAKTEVDAVNPNHYPPIFALAKVKNSLVSLRAYTDGAASFVTQAKPLIKVLPDLLGASNPRKYLILFQNDKELRPTGGFITAYSVFNIDKGKITVDKSDNIYNLDATVPNKPKAPAIISTYLNTPVLNLRDTNLSPDFIQSMNAFNSLYNKAGGRTKVDGIIAMDTSVLVSTIKILGDNISAGGMTFTTKTDGRCACPQVIYSLESSIATPLNIDIKVADLETIQAGRKDIIGQLFLAILTKALQSSPKVYWAPLFQDLITEVNQKHIMFDLNDAGAQQGIHAVNADGEITQSTGDYLHINEANLGGAKSNLFMQRAVSQDYKIQSDGSVVKTVAINWKNSFPASDCNLERGNLCLNAVMPDWIRIYVPKGSTLVSSKGSDVKITSYEELGKTVFDGFAHIRPQGASAFTISYKLPSSLTFNPTLPLIIQKQPGTYSDPYDITVNGSKFSSFPLLTDQTLVITK